MRDLQLNDKKMKKTPEEKQELKLAKANWKKEQMAKGLNPKKILNKVELN